MVPLAAQNTPVSVHSWSTGTVTSFITGCPPLAVPGAPVSGRSSSSAAATAPPIATTPIAAATSHAFRRTGRVGATGTSGIGAISKRCVSSPRRYSTGVIHSSVPRLRPRMPMRPLRTASSMPRPCASAL